LHTGPAGGAGTPVRRPARRDRPGGPRTSCGSGRVEFISV